MLAMAHEEARGCLFDFCGLRAEIEIKRQTMDLCPSCERELGLLGIDLDAVRGRCEAVCGLAWPASRRMRTRATQRNAL